MKDLSHRAAFMVVFGYDGAPFFGLQPQPNHPTAGGALIARITEALGEGPRGMAFAARTDRGVHAIRNVATFWTPRRPGGVEISDADVGRIADAIRAMRADHLVVHEVRRVPPHTHARALSHGKHYRYLVVDSQDLVDDDNNGDALAWRVAPTLDLEAMNAAAAALVGTHDFSSLRGAGCSAGTVEKTLTRLEVARGDDGVIAIDVEGDAFLRHMVRNLAGLLAEVGAGWRAPDTMQGVLEARSRQAAGLMAPAMGLTLVEVQLKDDLGLTRSVSPRG